MPTLFAYRTRKHWTQAMLAKALGVSQAYVSQLEAGGRPISRKLADRLARLPDLPPVVVPPDHTQLDGVDADFAAALTGLGYPYLRDASSKALPMQLPMQMQMRVPAQMSMPVPTAAMSVPPQRAPLNPAALLIAVIGRQQVAPNVMAAMPWVLMTYPTLDRRWLVDQARRKNLQNRVGFITDLALELLRARDRGAARRKPGDETADGVDLLEALMVDLEVSRLANPDTLARVLTPAEQQFFDEHRSRAARHWNLLTGMTAAQLPYR